MVDLILVLGMVVLFVPIESNTSRYAVLMKDTLLTGCAALNAQHLEIMLLILL